jgi:hypothetical protein
MVRRNTISSMTSLSTQASLSLDQFSDVGECCQAVDAVRKTCSAASFTTTATQVDDSELTAETESLYAASTASTLPSLNSGLGGAVPDSHEEMSAPFEPTVAGGKVLWLGLPFISGALLVLVSLALLSACGSIRIEVARTAAARQEVVRDEAIAALTQEMERRLSLQDAMFKQMLAEMRVPQSGSDAVLMEHGAAAEHVDVLDAGIDLHRSRLEEATTAHTSQEAVADTTWRPTLLCCAWLGMVVACSMAQLWAPSHKAVRTHVGEDDICG